jgi:S-adenosylmethionine:diacylglycerol 3-amino-3-carboxypropyl transferase
MARRTTIDPLVPIATLPGASVEYPKLHPIDAERVAVIHRASVSTTLRIASATLVDQVPQSSAPDLLFDATTRRLLVAMIRFDETGAPKAHVARLKCS